MPVRRDGQAVRADLVGDVTVGRDAVGSREHRVDLAGRHQRRGRAVHDHGERDPERVELPGREPRALEQRPRLADPHVLDETSLECGANGSKRGPVAGRRERARVAVAENPGARGEELHRMGAHAPAALDLRVVQRPRTFRRRVVTELVQGPAQVHGRRARGRQDFVGGVEVLPTPRRQREPVGGGDADRGRAAHGQRADGVGDLGRRRTSQVDLLVGQPPLVEHHHGVQLEANDVFGR